MGRTNEAAHLTQKLSVPLSVSAAAYPDPKEHQIVVEVRAVAANPVDWIIQRIGNLAYTHLKYPAVLGFDLAGVIVSLGSSVDTSRFRPGDRVLALATGTDKDENDSANAAFQRFAAVNDNLVSHIPDSLSFERAAVLPLGLATAAQGLFGKDNLALKHLPTNPLTGNSTVGRTVIVWGGSTSVGCNAIQLARAAGYQVVTTCSPHNFKLVYSLGARAALDYKSPTLARDLAKEIDGRPISGALYMGNEPPNVLMDVMAQHHGKAVSTKHIALAQSFSLPKDGASGLKLVGLMLSFAGGMGSMAVKSRLKGVSHGMFVASDIKKTPLAETIFREYLPKALEEGSFVPKPEPRVVGHGLDKCQEALDACREGVSACKLVVTL